MIEIDHQICYYACERSRYRSRYRSQTELPPFLYSMAEKKRVTIHEVAQEAGVSRQTVSRVINNRPDVASDTRKRVEEVIRELGYQPSAIARSLSRKRSHTFGVVISGLKYIGPSRTLNGISEQAEELGYGLLLKELLSFDINDTLQILNWFLAHQVDGIIWAVPEVGENRSWLDQQLPDLSTPLIFLTMENRADVPIVAVDNYLGGRMATEHLLDIGRKNIAHISGPLDWWEARERKTAWEDALSDEGFQMNDKCWEQGTWSPGSGERAMRALLEKYPDLDAVFVGNDQMALGALQLAHSRGIQIPNELAFVGFDGIPDSEYYIPPLTTIYQDQYNLGCTVVRELARLAEESQQDEGNGEPDQIKLKPELIIRQSTMIT
jgi:LacI family transcriptional regulator